MHSDMQLFSSLPVLDSCPKGARKQLSMAPNLCAKLWSMEGGDTETPQVSGRVRNDEGFPP